MARGPARGARRRSVRYGRGNCPRVPPLGAPPPPRPQRRESGFAHPGEHARSVGAPAVAQVVARLSKLNDAIRAALADPSRAKLDAVIDAARWARLDVDSALALKGHVADLRDAHWGRLRFAGRSPALATFAAFLEASNDKWDLIALRNLRERLEGLLSVARGLANDLG